ncbi:hypothetical protein C7B69_10965 [filamentous cyanobacterium Phorm 46]|nr:hypothetical protein C7B69_10965 [filamentous cyanobacterium Phorm 46]PSB53977.1 hypothetical protein C7B67_00690 [filamentous cyanobacterium Phorm 6]
MGRRALGRRALGRRALGRRALGIPHFFEKRYKCRTAYQPQSTSIYIKSGSIGIINITEIRRRHSPSPRLSFRCNRI